MADIIRIFKNLSNVLQQLDDEEFNEYKNKLSNNLTILEAIINKNIMLTENNFVNILSFLDYYQFNDEEYLNELIKQIQFQIYKKEIKDIRKLKKLPSEIYNLIICNPCIKNNKIECNVDEPCHLSCVQYLMEIENKDCINSEKTIKYAIANGYLKIVKYLIEKGKECTTNAIDLACRYGHFEIVKYLFEKGKECTTNAIDWACEYGHFEIVKYLIEKGEGCTTYAIDLACRYGYFEIVKYLIEKGKE